MEWKGGKSETTPSSGNIRITWQILREIHKESIDVVFYDLMEANTFQVLLFFIFYFQSIKQGMMEMMSMMNGRMSDNLCTESVPLMIR